MQKITIGNFPRVLFLVPAFVVIGSALTPQIAKAQGPKGPSAVAAARLKNKPPKNWIRHYLGDDRYKIAGGIWKVVSTETDRYYYPAWAPEMLRQPAGRVIGFPTAQDAEDAGYLPSAYSMGESLYGLSPDEVAAAKNRGGSARGPIPLKGKRITLSDGRSTIILPKGWKRTVLKSRRSQTRSYETMDSDMLQSGSGSIMQNVSIQFIKVPNTKDVAPFLTPQRFMELDKMMTPGGSSNQNMLDGLDIKPAAMGGLSGLRLTFKSSQSSLKTNESSAQSKACLLYTSPSPRDS